MDRRGFLLLDALLAVAATAVAASATFAVLTAAFAETGRADRRLAAEGLAAEALVEARTRCRHTDNPGGEPLGAGTLAENRRVGTRRFSLTLTKEVNSSCTGLFRLTAQVVPLDAAGNPFPSEAARLSLLGYDPW